LKRNPDSPDGFVLLDKPAGLTSSDALRPLKHVFGTGRVGHAGTLDRFATGTLVGLVGRYARLAPFFSGCDKTYRATLRLGAETETLDPEGAVVAEAPLPTREAIEAVLSGFRGDIMQSPPAYSAVHIEGKRAYQRARAGEDVAPAPRPVTIRSLELVSFDGRDAELLVLCTKGTYIRSLARDLAIAAGSRGHLAALRRVASGPFQADEGVGPETATQDSLRTLSPKEAAGIGLEPLLARGEAAARFSAGGRLHPRDFSRIEEAGFEARAEGEKQAVAVFDEALRLLGVAERSGARFSYLAVLSG